MFPQATSQERNDFDQFAQTKYPQLVNPPKPPKQPNLMSRLGNSLSGIKNSMAQKMQNKFSGLTSVGKYPNLP